MKITPNTSCNCIPHRKHACPNIETSDEVVVRREKHEEQKKDEQQSVLNDKNIKKKKLANQRDIHNIIGARES